MEEIGHVAHCNHRIFLALDAVGVRLGKQCPLLGLRHVQSVYETQPFERQVLFLWSLDADYDGKSQDLLDAMYQATITK